MVSPKYSSVTQSITGSTVLPKGSAHADPATVEHIVVLSVFDQELDSLLEAVDAADPGTLELTLRRYSTADDIYSQMQDAMRRIELKMAILSDKMVGFVGGKRTGL